MTGMPTEERASASTPADVPADRKDKGKRLWVLFWEMCKIALFVVGGGYAILAVADRVFSAKLKWTREGELVEELPILQMVPGLIAGNTAIYVGHKVAGRLGAVVGLVAVALPAFAIFLAVTCSLAALPLGNDLVTAAFFGSRCAITGIIIGTVWKSWGKNVKGVYGVFAAVATAVAIAAFHVNTALVLLVAMMFGISGALRGRVFCSMGAIPLVFLKYGLLCFGGGFVLVPMYIEEFVGPNAPLLQIAPEEFSNVIALTQMTPGPVSVNAATFFGYKMGGVAGAGLATACLLLPSLFLLVWALESIEKWKANRIVQGILTGVAPAAVGLLLAAAWAFMGMSVWNVSLDGALSVSIEGAVLSVAAAVVFLKTRFPPVALIFSCAAAGMAAWLIGCLFS